MGITPRAQRNASRTIHFIVAATLGTYVYAPEHVSDPLRPFLMFVGIPLAVLTGTFLWKQALFRRVARRAGQGPARTTSRAEAPVSSTRDAG
ncbi:hypothetical protein [Phytoactinopolyspora endophytica]|uniref:hypothetical protein n=1 Tax=Phytoactinopolyspora endophytica TaxID=1642495 RepID=UPI00101BE7BE|nr:hypothetical protein [Phytoactinopolyspora endophytica]